MLADIGISGERFLTCCAMFFHIFVPPSDQDTVRIGEDTLPYKYASAIRPRSIAVPFHLTVSLLVVLPFTHIMPLWIVSLHYSLRNLALRSFSGYSLFLHSVGVV